MHFEVLKTTKINDFGWNLHSLVITNVQDIMFGYVFGITMFDYVWLCLVMLVMFQNLSCEILRNSSKPLVFVKILRY